MYSLRQLSSTCFKRPEYPWLYSGDTTTTASAMLILAEKSACLMASPASFVGRGSFAISMRSVSTPADLPSSSVTSRAACRLIRPILAVPKITGMNKGRPVSMTQLLQAIETDALCKRRIRYLRVGFAPQQEVTNFPVSKRDLASGVLVTVGLPTHLILYIWLRKTSLLSPTCSKPISP